MTALEKQMDLEDTFWETLCCPKYDAYTTSEINGAQQSKSREPAAARLALETLLFKDKMALPLLRSVRSTAY